MPDATTHPTPRLIAVDWGTSRFRAFLIGADGGILAEAESDEGIGPLGGRGHAGVLARHCGAWRTGHPDTPVLLVGMVGSRNGWVEAGYAELPAGIEALASAGTAVPLPGGGAGRIVPGLIRRGRGRADVIRGEETLAFGAAADARRTVLCLPGTHSKWMIVEGGRITDFATFVTGELYGLLVDKSFIGSLATPGSSPAAFDAGIAAAKAREGALCTMFTARAGILDGSLPSEGVRDYLSGLLIATEFAGAAAAFAPDRVTIIASGELGERYRQASAAAGLPCDLVDTRSAFVAGALRIAALAKET